VLVDVQLVAERGPNILLEPRGVEAHDVSELIEALNEIIGSWTTASPSAGRYLIRTLDLLARHVNDYDELAAALDETAVYAGGHVPVVGGECCELLLAASDSIRSALTRIDAAHDPERGFHAEPAA
jgi:hypothetical protein